MANRNYPKNIAATTAIPFDNPVSALPVKTITGATTFTKVTTSAQAGYGAIVRVVANGSNVPDLSAFKSIGAGTFNNTNGVVNQLWFVYDGTDYCVAITQPSAIGGGGGGGDTTPPSLVSGVAVDTTHVNIVINESCTLTEGGWAIYDATAVTTTDVTSVSGSGTAWTLITTTPLVAGHTLSIIYTATAGASTDMSGNEFSDISGFGISNSIGFDALIFGSLTNLANSGGGLWTGTSSSPSYNNYGLATKKLASGSDGFIMWDISGSINESAMLAFRTDNAASRYDANDYKAAVWVYAGDIYRIDGGGSVTNTGATLTPAAGACLRIIRTGSVIKAQKSTDSGGSWTDVYTFTFSSTADLFINADVDATNVMKNPKGSNVV